MTWTEFEHLVRSVGQAAAVRETGRPAGYYWIEQRQGTLDLHGIVRKAPFQNEGIGTRVLQMLETTHAGQVHVIELGVQYDNTRARALHEMLGFRVVEDLAELGFLVMQKPLPV